MWKLLAVAGVVLGACVVPACGGGEDEQPSAAGDSDAAPSAAAALLDAGAPDATATAAAPREPEPPGGFHLDSIDDEPSKAPDKPAANRVNPIIQITLRSSPPGAMAAIDGKLIGRTPAFWEGEANGKPRDFTFVLPGYAMSRYRFVPVTSGVVHGRLTKLVVPATDAGPE